MSINRRDWLKTTTTVFAGIGLAPTLLATEKRLYRPADVIWLNSNENAYGPSDKTIKAMKEAVTLSNRYPDDMLPKLKQQLADFYSVGIENLVLGAGGSEMLALMSLLAAKEKGKIITPDPSFHGWYKQAEAFGLEFKKIPLTDDKKMNLPAMRAAIDKDTRMVYVCNPNNPTGTFIEDQTLRDFVQECSKHCLVLVDEAYTEFENRPSLKDMAITNPHVVVIKTFSKIYGLAGARVGYAIAHPDTARKLSSFQTWSAVNVSAVSAAAASAALKDQDFVNHCRDKNRQAREMCYSTFRDLKLDFVPSSTSFIIFNVDRIAAVYSKKLQEKNIYVQHRDHFGGKWSRVSMGTVEEMNLFCSALKEIS